MSVWSSVWPVVTFAVGGASTYFRDALTEKRRIEREKEARDAERHRVIVDRRETFELEHLEKTHAALSDLARAAGRAHHADSMAADQGASYGLTQFPADINEQLLAASRSVKALKGLVLDDQLRAMVDRAHVALNAPSGLRGVGVQEREAVFTAAIFAVENAQMALSARIREIYINAA